MQFNAEGLQATHQEGSFSNQRLRPRLSTDIGSLEQLVQIDILETRLVVNGGVRTGVQCVAQGLVMARDVANLVRNNFPPAAETPTSNRFDGLRNESSAWSVNEENDNYWERQSQYSGKRKPTSPVVTDISS